ncbi:DUF6807 domain-containing protein [Planctomicrobium piriforme]|uniref:Methane oxygenase PmoA n=1 Tax=Planctomicrobium piriforme TaxID=1576369 RepID=A0A1I3R097_9PLAN|nr:PmoA family protein [Planctomicrobium piriforme]SFJ38827.1 Methane oxygenase PmoA [Planctomicrobium piriforme]
MRRFAAGCLAWLVVCSVAFAEDQKVTLDKQRESVKVMLGDDVFTVFRFGPGRRKPFFQPVTGPGGFELLKEAVSTQQPDSPARKVFVVSEIAPLTADEGAARVAHYGDVLTVDRVDGNKLWISARNGWINRSDVAPLAATVTRLINDNPLPIKDKLSPDFYDHPHHKGIWFSVDEINGIKFWMEESRVAVQSVEVEQGKGNPAVIKFVSHWLDKKDAPVLKEETTVSFYPNRLMTYDVKLSAAGESVKIGDTKEGMFAIRLPNSMREYAGGGPVTNADGANGTKEAWGKPSHWVNYNGPVDGHVFGVAIMDSPKNPWASRYHVRDYGLFSINPFGAGAYTAETPEPQPAHARELKAGEDLHFKYGIWIHDGALGADEINKVYEGFAK